MSVLYNEFDKKKAAWLRHLIEEGAIAHGIVDERPIQALQPEDLRGFTQVHFFAGIGIWSYALRLAGWPDDRPVWTGSCPCGPFSAAGLRKGFDDPRHLWPEWVRLIGERRPDVLFGEQSDQADAWLDLVQSDLEGHGYAVGAAVIPAAGFGGAHERHRIGFVADTDNAQWWSERAPWNDGGWPKTGRVQGYGDAGERLPTGGLADAGTDQHQVRDDRTGFRSAGELAGLCDAQWLDDASGARCDWEVSGSEGNPRNQARLRVPSPGGGHDWLYCRDRRWRPVEPGTFPLVDEDSARLGRLRGYGDAIDAETFANLIGAYMDASPGRVAA